MYETSNRQRYELAELPMTLYPMTLYLVDHVGSPTEEMRGENSLILDQLLLILDQLLPWELQEIWNYNLLY